jgi:hypothetical protein
MHSLATIMSKVTNRKANSVHSTRRDSQNSDVPQIRNTDDAY